MRITPTKLTVYAEQALALIPQELEFGVITQWLLSRLKPYEQPLLRSQPHKLTDLGELCVVDLRGYLYLRPEQQPLAERLVITYSLLTGRIRMTATIGKRWTSLVRLQWPWHAHRGHWTTQPDEMYAALRAQGKVPPRGER